MRFATFRYNTFAPGAGGVGAQLSRAEIGGGGGGGVLMNGGGPSGGNGQYAKGGAGYGAGGGGGYFLNGHWAAGGNGADGLVYIEW